jgi:hypothetical protein
VQRIAAGLWRWTARHPEWKPGAEPESPADWPPDVGCVAYETEGAVALIGPLVVDGWETLDELVRERPVSVLTTLDWHRRSSTETIERYGATTAPPAGVEEMRFADAGETMFWLPVPLALVPGDRILGVAGGLRLCPESWLGYLPSRIGLGELREQLRPLLELPIELVLVSHGEPVLSAGREALAKALRA